MKNCVILEIREATEKVNFAVQEYSYGPAQLLTEEEAVAELEKLCRKCPNFKFQVVVLRLGETTEFDRTN